MAQKINKYCYEYPRPAVTADVICLRPFRRGVQVLLIRRKHDPYQGFWALPGGFVNIDEDLEPAARRELREETGLEAPALRQLQTFGKPDRDPRGRTISVAFLAWFGHNKVPKKLCAADDAADVKWFSVNKLPELAFDHDEIIRQGLEVRKCVK